MCLFSVRFIFIGGGKRLFAEYQAIADETKCQRDRVLTEISQKTDMQFLFIMITKLQGIQVNVSLKKCDAA